MQLTILGQTPSQKNNKQLFKNRATGKLFITSSEITKHWQRDALWQLKGKPSIKEYPIALICTFYMKDNRRRDLDNCLTSILDVLVKAGIIVDDCWQQLCPITLNCGGIDKTNPRVEIILDD